MRRGAEPRLNAAVLEVKRFQHERLTFTYDDLLRSPRYAAAARFFLEDLYGPSDFTRRDTQFARVVPALVRLFPSEIVSTVVHLASLHALSEALDFALAERLSTAPVARSATGPAPGIGPRSLEDSHALGRSYVDLCSYAQAWKEVGRHDDRGTQIELTRRVGDALDRYTRKRGLRQTLRLMRIPARSAGLEELQQFLERGFDTFHSMGGAAGFLHAVTTRETAMARAFFHEPGPAHSIPLAEFVSHVLAGLGEPS